MPNKGISSIPTVNTCRCLLGMLNHPNDCRNESGELGSATSPKSMSDKSASSPFSNPSCQLFSQKSIGSTARQDLAKFAALQNLAQQHPAAAPNSPWSLQQASHIPNSPHSISAASVGLSRSPYGYSSSGAPSESSADGRYLDLPADIASGEMRA